MRRLRRTLLLAAAIAAVAAAPALASGVRISPAGSAQFPDRGFVLTLPQGMSAAPSQVHVTENGRPVGGPSFVSAGNSDQGRFGVVLAIDTSSSMRGPALDSAFAAAREFARRRNPRQKVGVVTFNATASTLLAPTTDSSAIDSALAQPPATRGGTHIYDAVGRAIDLLSESGVSAGSVIVISDGADRGSKLSLAALTARANAAGVRVFAVGLRSSAYDATTLTSMARDGGGEYAEASSPARLRGIYDELASQLANQYLLTYQSLARPGTNVRVKVSIEGVGSASTGYATPTAPRPGAAANVADRGFWASGAAMAAVAVVTAFLVGLALVAVLMLVQRRKRTESRLEAFVGPVASDSGQRRAALIADHVLGGAERSLGRMSWWHSFSESVDLARIETPPVKLAMWTAVGSLGALILLSAVGNPLFGVLAAALIPLAVHVVVQRRVTKQRTQFGEQLPDNLQVIASAMRAGNSFTGALAVAADDAAEPARRELQRAVNDEQLGVPFDDALRSVGTRMQNADLNQVILVASLQRETGGNTAEVLDRVTDAIRERMELRRLVRTLTAQGRMARWVVTALPVGLAVALSVISPGYLAPLVDSTLGRIALGLAVAMLVIGSLAIKKIVNIKV